MKIIARIVRILLQVEFVAVRLRHRNFFSGDKFSVCLMQSVVDWPLVLCELSEGYKLQLLFDFGSTAIRQR